MSKAGFLKSYLLNIIILEGRPTKDLRRKDSESETTREDIWIQNQLLQTLMPCPCPYPNIYSIRKLNIYKGNKNLGFVQLWLIIGLHCTDSLRVMEGIRMKHGRVKFVRLLARTQSSELQGVPKKIRFKPILEFLTLGRVFLGVKNNSKNFENKKNIRLFSKILSKWTLFY